MPLSPKLLAGAAFLGALGLSAVAAQTIVRTLEERSVEAVAARLGTGGFDWAEVLGDGLQVILEGEAPTEAARFEAISAAAQVVDGARVIDNLRVAAAQEVAPPDFALEILRNDAGVSLIGLLPAATDREELLEDFAEAAGGQEVSDLLQAADYPVPPGWEPALDYAVDALELLPRAKVSVSAGRVSIEAISDSPEAQRRLESELARMAPQGVRLGLSVSAPRPVIAPFTLRATLEDGRLLFDACSADTEEARDAILSAATAAGSDGKLDCRLGLGSPSPDWGAAVASGLAALRDLGEGTLAFSDTDVALVAAPGTDRALFDRVAGELDGALPAVFALEATRPEPATVATEPEQGPIEFTASLAEGGAVRLEGRLGDARMTGLLRAFAQARFGAGDVQVATRPGAQGLPEGWTLRVLAGVEALSRLNEGRVTVTPDAITVLGLSGRRAARDEIAARAIETLGPGASLRIEVAYDEALDPLAALPTPEECLAKITAVTDAAKITFDPGSATISAEGEPVIEAIAEILRACPDLRLRIAGYTDAQGREETNQELSQARAEAVLEGLRAERVPVSGFEAQGYGEADPIASNETEAGREANRRIEFALLGEEEPARAAGPAVAAAGEPTPGEEEPVAAAEPLMDQPPSPPERPRAVEEDGTERLAEEAEAAAPEDDDAPAEEEAQAAAAEGEEDGDDRVSPEAAIAAIAQGAPGDAPIPAAAAPGPAPVAQGPSAPPGADGDGPATPATALAAREAEGGEEAQGPGSPQAPAAGPAVEAGVAPAPRTAEENGDARDRADAPADGPAAD